MKFLEALPTSGDDTNLEKAVQGLLHRGARTGLAVVVSDLFDEHGFQRGLDQLRIAASMRMSSSYTIRRRPNPICWVMRNSSILNLKPFVK